MLGTKLWAADGITLGLDEGTELGSLDGSSDGSNELVIGSDEGIVSFQLNLSRQFPAPCTVLQFFSNLHLSTIASFVVRVGVGVRVRVSVCVHVRVRVHVRVGIRPPMYLSCRSSLSWP